MKKSAFLIFTVIAFAACNNSSTQQTISTNDSIAAEPPSQDHTTMDMPVTRDTTVILPNQKVFFPNLKDGQTIKLPFIIKFGVEGMEVKPAMGVEPNVGHHHITIDNAPIPTNTMFPMQNEAQGYYHFGKGELQDTFSIKKYPMLTPGKHTVTLQFANSVHLSYGPAMSKTITITVK